MDTATCLFPPNHSAGRSRSSSSSSTTTNGVTLRRRSPRKRKAPAAYNTAVISTSSSSHPNHTHNNNHTNNNTNQNKQPRVLAELVTFCDEGTYWNEVKRKRPLVTDQVQQRAEDPEEREEGARLPPSSPHRSHQQPQKQDRVNENDAPLPPQQQKDNSNNKNNSRSIVTVCATSSNQRSPLYDKAVVPAEQQQQQQHSQQTKTKNRMMNVNDVMSLSTKYNSNNSNSSTNDEEDASIAVTTETAAEEHSVASSVTTINTTTTSSSSGPMILPSASKKVNTATNKTMPDTPTTKLATVTRDEDEDDNDDDDDATMEVSPSSTSAAVYHAHVKGGDRTDDRSGSSIRWARKTTPKEDDVAPLMPSHSISSPSFSSPVLELENGARSDDDPAAAGGAGAMRSPPRSHTRGTMMRMSKAPSTGKKTPVRASSSSRPSPGATLTKKTPSSILRRRCTPVKSGDIADGTIRERAAVEPTSDQHFDALVAFACPSSTSISMDGAAAASLSSSAAVASPSNTESTRRRPITTVKAATTTAGDAANTTQVIIMDCHTLGQQLELLFPEKFLSATEQHQLPRTTTAVGIDTGSRVIQLRRVPVRRCNVSSTLRHVTTEPDSPPCILPRLIACYTLYRDQQNQQRPHSHSPQHKRRRSSMLTNVSIFPILQLLQQLVDLEWTTLEGHEHQGEVGEEAAFLSPTHSDDATTNGSGTYQDFFPPDGIVNCWNNNTTTTTGFDTATTTNAVITQGSDTDTVDGAEDTTTTTIAANRDSRKSQRRVQFAAFDETAVVRAPVDVLEGSYKPQEKCVHALLAVMEAVAELFPTAAGGSMSTTTTTTTTAATTILRDIILYLDTEFVALKHDKLCVESMYEMNEQSIPIRRIEKAAIAYSKSFTSLLDPLGRRVPQTYATACATTINGGHNFGSDGGGKNNHGLPKATLLTIIPIRLERVHTFVRSRPLSWECRLANASAQLVRYWLRTILNPIPGRADFETKTDQWSSRLYDYVKLTETEESYTTFEDDDHDDDGGMSCATDDSSVETLDDDNVSSLLSNALGHVYMYLNLESWGALSWKERLLRVLPDPSCCATVVCREGIGTNKKPTYLTEKDWMEVEEQLTIASDFCAFHRRAVFVERLLSVIVKLDWKDRWSDTVQSAAHKLVRLNKNKIGTGTRNDSDTIGSHGNHSNTTAGIYDAFGNSSIIIQPEDLHLLLLGMPMQDLLDRLRTDVIPLSRARYEICHPNLRATEGNFRLGLRNTKMKQKYLPRIKDLEETWSEWLHPGTNFPSISYTGTIPRYFNTDDDDDDDDDGS